MNKFKPISQDKLDAMRAREDAATPEPWRVCSIGNNIGIDPVCDAVNARYNHDNEVMRKEAQGNADFVVHARTDQPYLRVAYQALLAEYEKRGECLRNAKVQHRLCRVDCVGLGGECDC